MADEGAPKKKGWGWKHILMLMIILLVVPLVVGALGANGWLDFLRMQWLQRKGVPATNGGAVAAPSTGTDG